MLRGATQLSKFDPFRMPSDLVRRLAVGRDAALRGLLDAVEENLAAAPDAPPQHLCLVAPRGTGKTFLFRLLGLELAERVAAGRKLRFLHLPEEMPHVLSPPAFLREIRKRLQGEGPAANAPRKHEDPSAWATLIRDIDDHLAAQFGPGEGLLVLGVENIKDVLRDAFGETGQQRDLRAWLERPSGRIMMIAGSSAGPFDRDADKALFGIVRNVELKPWTSDETMVFLDRVMRARHGHGLRAEDERVARAITSFTGGNPRMAVALAEVLGADDALSAARTLDGLIDNLQQYYLDRLGDMGREGKRCVGNLLTEGENVSQTEVARRLGVAQSEVAQVFRKLEDNAVIVGERIAGQKEKLYRVADRVFVHFYNVRVLYHGTERSVLAPILDFLVSAFSQAQRQDQAERLMARGLHDDAQVLMRTLPVLTEGMVDFKWWTGVKEFLDWTADIIAARASGAGAVEAAAIREVVGDRRRAADLVARYEHAPDGCDADLSRFVTGLGHLAAGQPPQARQWLGQVAGGTAPPWLACLASLALAYTEYLAGEMDALLLHAKTAESLARNCGDTECLEMSLCLRAFAAFSKGDAETGEKCAKDICELPYPTDREYLAATGWRLLSEHASRRGDDPQATAFARQALAIAERAQRPSFIALAKTWLAFCLWAENRVEQALDLAGSAAAVFRDKQDFNFYCDAQRLACAALRTDGRQQEAIGRAEETVRLADEHGSPYLRARAYANLAWELAFAHESPRQEALDFARRALAILEEDPALSWVRSLALEAWLGVVSATGEHPEQLAVALRLAPVARQTGRLESLGWALERAVHGHWLLRQYQDCIDQAISALEELLPVTAEVWRHTDGIAWTLAQALRAAGRQGEAKPAFDRVRRHVGPDSQAKAAATFLRVALEIGDYPWGVELARHLLDSPNRENASPTKGGGIDMALACIAGADAWEQMAPHLDESFWSIAADEVGGYDVAGVVESMEQANGRPAAYAVFHGLWATVRGAVDVSAPQSAILRQFLTDWRMPNLSAGLLTDVADTLAAEAPGRFEAEERMLREFARFNAANRDPAMLARLDPDVARALRIADPSLAEPPLAPAGKARGTSKKKGAPRSRQRG